MLVRLTKLALLLMALTAVSSTAQAAPRVVASIKPLQSLAAGVMEGIGVPDVLLKGGGSPHTYSLKPSDAEMLGAADVIFWVGPIFETFLEKPLVAMSKPQKVFSLANVPGIDLLTGDGHSSSSGELHLADGHIWLDPVRAKVITRHMTDVLAAADPGNADIYRRNAAQVVARLDALDTRLRAQLAPVASKPYVVFHDAYGYFEARYGLAHVGAITISPERPPGARRLAEIRTQINNLKAVCVFSEPQFEPKLIQSLFSESNTRFGVLDPEGSTLAPGRDLVFNLLQDLADNFVRCLASQ